MRLAGKAAIVTGAATGNGRAIALGLAKAGAKVAIVDLDSKGGGETAGEIKTRGGHAISFTGDVSDEHAVSRMVKASRGGLWPDRCSC